MTFYLHQGVPRLQQFDQEPFIRHRCSASRSLIVIGIGGLLLGVPLMLLCSLKYKEYFGRKLEVAAPGSLDVQLEEVKTHF